MRSLILLLIASFSLNTAALTEADFFAGFDQNSELARSGQSREICDSIFAEWPSARYAERIRLIGNEWSNNPDAAYEILSTCQAAWVNQYLDPTKASKIRLNQERASIGEYITQMDFLATAKYLREEIALFLKIKPPADAGIPPAPYEVLTLLASTERQMDMALHYETSRALKDAIQAGGFVGATSTVGIKFFKLAEARSVVASKAIKQAKYISILALVGAGVLQYTRWQSQYNELSNQAESYRLALNNPRVIRALALEQFQKSVELLGYFFTYKLFLKDGGKDTLPAASSEACDAALRARLTPGQPQPQIQASFLSQWNCRDAATLWLNASAYLQQNFPNDEDAQTVASNLLRKAKHAFWAYEETRAYLKGLKVCTPVYGQVLAPGVNPMQCRDPETGADVT